MRWMIASDIHGSAKWCRAMLDAFDREGADRLLLLGDLAARNAAAPVVLPIGAITSFLGAPLFLYLLFKGRNRP